MTEAEIRAREKDLAKEEEELQSYAREILERERAVQAAEERIARRGDIDRTDYLFDSINRHQASYKPVVVEMPTPQTRVIVDDSPLDWLTAISTMLGAVFALTILILILV